jgi:hypothetical protein
LPDRLTPRLSSPLIACFTRLRDGENDDGAHALMPFFSIDDY